MKPTLAAAWVAFLVGLQTDAAVIYLGDQDRSPAPNLEISGITFQSAPSFPAQPSTVAGTGLGSALIGPPGSVDALWHFDKGSLNGAGPMEGLALSLGPGVTLHSITLLPYFTMSGSEQTLPFTFSYLIQANNAPTIPSYVTAMNNVPVELNLHADFYDIYALELTLESAGANDNRFAAFRSENARDQADFAFGFTVQYMTLTVVPEPGAGALLALGALTWMWKRRRAT